MDSFLTALSIILSNRFVPKYPSHLSDGNNLALHMAIPHCLARRIIIFHLSSISSIYMGRKFNDPLFPSIVVIILGLAPPLVPPRRYNSSNLSEYSVFSIFRHAPQVHPNPHLHIVHLFFSLDNR